MVLTCQGITCDECEHYQRVQAAFISVLVQYKETIFVEHYGATGFFLRVQAHFMEQRAA